jgi:hypothetical protein
MKFYLDSKRYGANADTAAALMTKHFGENHRFAVGVDSHNERATDKEQLASLRLYEREMCAHLVVKSDDKTETAQNAATS